MTVIDPAKQKTELTREAERSLAPAIQRAIRVLALLETAPQRHFGITEIARRLEIPKSTTLNICIELVNGHLLRRSLDGYQLGRKLIQLGAAYVSSVDLVREFYEVCRSAPQDLNAMIQLGVLDDELNVVFLARQDCNSGLRLGLRAEIGRRVPANCSGTGKALLAALSEEVLDARLTGLRSLPTLTDRSISDPAELRRQIVSIRQTGYASEREEALSGVACLARAFRTTYRDNGILAMSITAREHMVTTDLSEIMRRTLFDLTYQLETRL